MVNLSKEGKVSGLTPLGQTSPESALNLSNWFIVKKTLLESKKACQAFVFSWQAFVSGQQGEEKASYVGS